MFLVGKIVSTFGNKGDLKIYPYINPPDLLLDIEEFFLDDGSGNKQKFKIAHSKRHKNIYIFSLDGINDMDVAESLVDYSIYVPSLDFKDLEENEFFYHQLEGLTVYNESGDLLGKVDHILKGGNDILVVKDESGKEIMIPFVDEFVPEVNLPEKSITVSVIEGLI